MGDTHFMILIIIDDGLTTYWQFVHISGWLSINTIDIKIEGNVESNISIASFLISMVDDVLLCQICFFSLNNEYRPSG